MPRTRSEGYSVWVTINLPGASGSEAEPWQDVAGGGTEFKYVPGPTSNRLINGAHSHDPLALTSSGLLPEGAWRWVEERYAGASGLRDVLVEVKSSNGSVLTSRTYRNAVLSNYQGPDLDAASRLSISESIAFVFESVDVGL